MIDKGKPQKKVLSLVLCLAMMLSVMVVGAGAAFTDEKDFSANYQEAAEVLTNLEVLQGYPDGSFQPQGDITRAETAAIIYRVVTGDVTDKYVGNYTANSQNQFSDVKNSDWFAGYVNYCADAQYIKGYGDGTFGPNDKVTGYEALAMILRAVGYDQDGSFTGEKWTINTASVAQSLNILKNVKDEALGSAAPRELVAELIFQAMNVPTVTWTLGLGYNQYNSIMVNGVEKEQLNPTLGEKTFKLEAVESFGNDVWGRDLGSGWKYVVNGEAGKTVISVPSPLATYTEATKNCDIYEDTGLAKGTPLPVYTNAKSDGTYKIVDNTKTYGAQGRLTEVYADRVINIDTYLAVVTDVTAESTDSRGHVTPASVKASVYSNYATNEVLAANLGYETDEFAVGDVILVTVSEATKNDKTVYTIQSAETATAVKGQLDKVSGGAKIVDNIQKVLTISDQDVTVNHTATYEPSLKLGNFYTFYYDQYGNVIGAANLAKTYAVLDSLYRTTTSGNSAANGTVVFFDATADQDATINNIDKETAVNFGTDKAYNGAYYNNVYTYTEHDGIYILKDANFNESTAGEYRSSNGADSGYMMVKGANGDNVNLQLSKTTEVLLQTKDSPDGTFTSYVGYQNLPNFEASVVQWIDENNDGYVDYLYALGARLTSRTVFVYDINPTTSSTTEYPGWYVANVSALELNNGELEETSFDVLYKRSFNSDTDVSARAVDHIGLYEIVETEDYGLYYAINEEPIQGVDQITADGQRVEINGTFENLDDAVITKYVGTWTEGKTSPVKADTLTKESIVVAQRDENGKIVALYDLWIKLNASVVDENGDSVEGASAKPASQLYVGKVPSAITVNVPAYWNLSDINSVDPVDNANTLDKTAFKVTGDDLHETAATLTVNVNNGQQLWGDVVITLEQDPKHDSTWLIASKPAGNRNIEVTVNTNGTITVSGDDAMTATVADLKAWLTPECDGADNASDKHTVPCNHASYTVYDNTVATPVTDDSTLLNGHNMFIIVKTEAGTTAQYDIRIVDNT